MSQPEALPLTQIHTQAEAAITAPTTSTPAAPSLVPVGPTLETTEKLLAEHFAKHVSKELLPSGLHLTLSVHIHEGKENLNLTFNSTKGFGLTATEFSDAVNKALHILPAFASRLKENETSPAIATLKAAETPKDDPNALRLVMKFSTPQLVKIAQELHGITPAAEHADAACASGKCGHDHSKDTTTQSTQDEAHAASEAAKPANQLLEGPAPASIAANEGTPSTVIEAPVAAASRTQEPPAKAATL